MRPPERAEMADPVAPRGMRCQGDGGSVREALSSPLWQERVGVYEYHGSLIQRGTNQR